ncbi:MAG: DNA polymerase III subunit chi [Alphaproteobacteria bacterium]|nr:DNA polymerase III subunit chi [Alphaproteobacteria bacterium]
MTEVAFYHLQHWPLEKALPKLLELTLDRGKRAVVLFGNAERVEPTNALLWSYDPDSWIPHGSARDGDAAMQPVWLTAADENPNGAQFLFLADGAVSTRIAEYERCFEIFDGNDPAAVEVARARWTAYKDAGHALAYWQQTEQGGWARKE